MFICVGPETSTSPSDVPIEVASECAELEAVVDISADCRTVRRHLKGVYTSNSRSYFFWNVAESRRTNLN